MSLIILDIGSSSVRALLFTYDADLVMELTASESYAFTTTPPGAATIDARHLQHLVETCIDRITQHPAAKEIHIFALDTFVGNVLGVDDQGQAVTPVFTYADTRSDADILKERVDQAAVHQRTGCMIHSAYQPSKLYWLKRTQPETFKKAVRWVDFATYLYTQWFGKSFCSTSVASWSGMLNFQTMDWDEEWLSVLELDKSRLPPLADFDRTQSGLLPEYARRWPQLRNVPFCLAMGDGAAANVGSGCVDESKIALTIGTTAAMRVVSSGEIPKVPAGLWRYCIDSQHFLTGGATSEGGNIFAWVRETVNLPEQAVCEALLQTRTPDSHGLTFLPLLAGERSPGWATDATGAMIGLRLSTKPLDILQAALEGVALRLAMIAEQLGDGAAVIGSGGALEASPVWCQMVANALNRPLLITGEKEITARGTAILARRALGKAGLNAFPPSIVRTVEPQPEHVEIMLSARERQQRLYRVSVLKKEI